MANSLKHEAIQRHAVTGALFALLALGLTGYYLASYLDFLGLQYISARLERLILFLYPTMVVVLTAWLYRQASNRAKSSR
ncbi:hypothetical protein [Sulfuriferula plumbiphila]|uniref:hypothetical protein n=1 Tax=Sulfuriferula plumbiphila TaxID=171865 RepID=UPI001E3770B9|nr:hypothetical protein [Sulfuriferula plumbiphila]